MAFRKKLGADLFFFINHVLVVVVVGNYQDPDCVWPLTDESYGVETVSGTYNAQLTNCDFEPGPSQLGGKSLRVDGTTVIEIYNGGDYFGADFMVSAFFYSASSTVTLFHYVDSGNNNIFKVWSTGSHLRVEVFRADGNSLGSASETYNLKTNRWLQIGFLREKSGGVIKVFVDTEKVVDIDDSFPDKKSLPNGGRLRVGTPFSTAMSSFVGKITCIQIYTALISEGEMDSVVLDNCKRSKWISKITPTASQTCTSNSPTTQALAYTSQSSTSAIPTTTALVDSPASLTSAIQTTTTPAQSQTETSIPEMNSDELLNGYFVLRMRNSIPSESGSRITSTVTKGIFSCGSQCLISSQCLSFSISKLNSFEKNCSLFDSKADNFLATPGFTYYIRTDK